MSRFDNNDSFLRRTADAAECARRERPSSENERIVLPTFLRVSFLFKDGEEPDHIDAYPALPTYPDMYEVYDETREGKKMPLAVDVPTFAMASLLARARVGEVESTLGIYHYSDDVWILNPDQTAARVYRGIDLS